MHSPSIIMLKMDCYLEFYKTQTHQNYEIFVSFLLIHVYSGVKGGRGVVGLGGQSGPQRLSIEKFLATYGEI